MTEQAATEVVSGHPSWFWTVLLTRTLAPIDLFLWLREESRIFPELIVGRFSLLSLLVKFWGLYFPPMLLLSGVKCIVGKVADL